MFIPTAPDSNDESTSDGAPPSRRSPAKSVAAYLLVALIVVLNILYLTIGDRAPWSEYATIWPPVLWLGLILVIAAPLLWRLRNIPLYVLIAALVLFALTLLEIRPLLRWGTKPKAPDALRVITWNIGGGYESKRQLLDEMARWQPDLVLLQETPDGSASFTEDTDLTGYWQGFAWHDGGDCGVLSRWPLRELETTAVGLWDEPQVLAVDGPWSRPLMIVNVRLMLPSLELLPLSTRSRTKLIDGNRDRLAQFPRLVELMEQRRGEASYAGVVLGGDLNTDASARSLDPVRAVLRDVWPVAGIGWGGTATRDFPVARIDHLYVSQDLHPIQAFVPRSRLSDHRPLVVDLEFAGTP